MLSQNKICLFVVMTFALLKRGQVDIYNKCIVLGYSVSYVDE